MKILCLVWIACFVLVQSQNLFIERGGFSLKVTGNQNVPKFEFWRTNQSYETYRVQMQRIFEARRVGEDYKKEGGSEIALPSLSWSFSDLVEVDNHTVNFNITCTGGNKARWEKLQFRNYLRMICADDKFDLRSCQNGTIAELKFDIVIEDYKYSYEENQFDKDVLFVIVYQLTGGNGNVNKSKNQIRVGDAYFKFVNYALLNESNPDKGNVTVNYSVQGNNIWLVYDHLINQCITILRLV
jgi:hypothetical protein